MQKIQLAQIYELPVIRYFSFIHCYPVQFADERIDLSSEMLETIEKEKQLTVGVVIDRPMLGSVSIYYWNNVPFMIEKRDDNRHTHWITNKDMYNIAYMYLKTKEIIDQCDDNIVVHDENDLIIPQVFEIFGGEYHQIFAKSEYNKKTGVMLLPVKNILHDRNYDSNDRLVLVSENTEPLADVICRGTTFFVKMKTFDTAYLCEQNERIVKQLVWNYGSVRDYHLYTYIPNFEFQEETIVDFV